MAFITEKQLEDKLDIPINLPITQLLANDWLIVSVADIPEANPTTVTLRWLILRGITSVGTGTGSIELGLYKDFNINISPWLQTPLETALVLPFPLTPSEELEGTNVNFVMRNPYSPLVISKGVQGFGLYSWVAFFHLTTTVSDPSQYVRLTVNGQARIDINPT